MFYDPVESPFYGICVERLILCSAEHGEHIRELGAGTGRPVIEALRRHTGFTGLIRGYEINPDSCATARALIRAHGIEDRYEVHNRDFFTSTNSRLEACAIANPPYLPAATNHIDAPELWGGTDGGDVTRRIMSVGFRRVMLMISSYSNPVGVISHALNAGYVLVDWLTRPIAFGVHSRQSRVHQQIRTLASNGLAFVSDSHYLLSGTLWTKSPTPLSDRSTMFRRMLSQARSW